MNKLFFIFSHVSKCKLISCLFTFLLVIFSVLAFVSCGDDEVDADLRREKKETMLTWVVKCNNPIAHVEIYTPEETVMIGYWTMSYKTKSYFANCFVRCLDDPLATVTIELYRNGKLYAKKSAIGSSVEILCRIKGRGI